MVIINKNKEYKKPDLARFSEILKDYRSGKDVITGERYNLDEGIALPAETAVIIDLK